MAAHQPAEELNTTLAHDAVCVVGQRKKKNLTIAISNGHMNTTILHGSARVVPMFMEKRKLVYSFLPLSHD